MAGLFSVHINTIILRVLLYSCLFKKHYANQEVDYDTLPALEDMWT